MQIERNHGYESTAETDMIQSIPIPWQMSQAQKRSTVKRRLSDLDQNNEGEETKRTKPEVEKQKQGTVEEKKIRKKSKPRKKENADNKKKNSTLEDFGILLKKTDHNKK